MRRRSSKKQDEDVDQKSLPEVIEQPITPITPVPVEKNPAAVALGKLGGAKGGKARAAKLSAKKRSEIAKKSGTSAVATKKTT